MNLIDVIVGRASSIDDAEEELGKPDDMEAKDLPLHVYRCGKRWALSYRLSRNNSAQLAQIRVLLAIAGVIGVVDSPPGQKLWALLFG